MLEPSFQLHCFARHARLKAGAKTIPWAVLLVAVDDATAGQIVWRKLDGDFVTGQNANEILPHLSRDVREHLMFIFELDAKHRVGKRLNYSGHYFDGVFFTAALAGFLLFVYRSFCHALLKTPRREKIARRAGKLVVAPKSFPPGPKPRTAPQNSLRSKDLSCIHQTGPLASLGRVKTQGPLFVTATVCSKCAESLPSSVTAVQSSSKMRTAGPPEFTIGSIARTSPCCKRGPTPGEP